MNNYVVIDLEMCNTYKSIMNSKMNYKQNSKTPALTLMAWGRLIALSRHIYEMTLLTI